MLDKFCNYFVNYLHSAFEMLFDKCKFLVNFLPYLLVRRQPSTELFTLPALFHKCLNNFRGRHAKHFRGCGLIKFQQAVLLALRHILHVRQPAELVGSLAYCPAWNIQCDVKYYYSTCFRKGAAAEGVGAAGAIAAGAKRQHLVFMNTRTETLCNAFIAFGFTYP